MLPSLALRSQSKSATNSSKVIRWRGLTLTRDHYAPDSLGQHWLTAAKMIPIVPAISRWSYTIVRLVWGSYSIRGTPYWRSVRWFRFTVLRSRLLMIQYRFYFYDCFLLRWFLRKFGRSSGYAISSLNLRLQCFLRLWIGKCFCYNWVCLFEIYTVIFETGNLGRF